ncbi:ring canal kelch homolog isoform X1 [Acyrthosiphon pisum]|uniref:Uncharacterized protein n=1 Tax=Acyrthosiphon pisum TaxID=7029 RepID=A0A8R2JRJ0_ACYPI|nr:ring canal kelch homolog isoform X1 [Acyrthosiphon pisum]
MEHIRLSLLSKRYILENVVNEPLLKNSSKCKDYVIDALNFHLIKSLNPFTNPQTIWSKPRQSGDLRKVILVLGRSESTKNFSINWYDPSTNTWQRALDMRKGWLPVHLALIANQFVFGVGSSYKTNSQSVKMLDLYSQTSSWLPLNDMSVGRTNLGVGVLNNCVYAVGGHDGVNGLNSAEVFDVSIQEWRMVSSMSSKRFCVGVGVLNNLLYAVGGYDSSSKQFFKSVECYDPSIDRWKLVAELSICRSRVSVGVLDGVMYAIGGWDGSVVHKSVEVYTERSKVWTSIPDMHICRRNPGNYNYYFFKENVLILDYMFYIAVVVLDGLLYVMGGTDEDSTNLDSLEIYNPKTNTWKLVESSLNDVGLIEIIAGVVIDGPPHFKTH